MGSVSDVSSVNYGRSETEIFEFVSLSVSYLYRGAALLLMGYFLWKIFDSLAAAFVFLNAIIFHMAGTTQVVSMKLVNPFLELQLVPSVMATINHTVQVHSRMYLKFYDYAALVVIFCVIYLVSKGYVAFYSPKRLTLIGFLSASVFEHIGVVVAIACAYIAIQTSERAYFKIGAAIASGTGLYIVVVLLLSRLMLGKGETNLFSTYRSYAIGNIRHFDQVLAGALIVVIPSLVLGFLCSTCKLLHVQTYPEKYDQVILGIEGILLGLVCTYFVGFFTSGMSSEIGRQTLAFQVLLIIYTAIMGEKFFERRKTML